MVNVEVIEDDLDQRSITQRLVETLADAPEHRGVLLRAGLQVLGIARRRRQRPQLAVELAVGGQRLGQRAAELGG